MRARSIVFVVLIGLVAAACGNAGSGNKGATPSSGAPENRPGVTADTIRVGGIASVQNPLGGPYGSVFDGAQAYFDMVNASGGVFGKKIELVKRLDDGSAASRNTLYARELVDKDNVFAVIPVATLQFTGAQYLADHDIPTFGWNINAEWQKGPTLFGQRGSYTCFTCAGPLLPYLAHQINAQKVGIIAYNVPQSKDCATGQKNGFEKYGPPVAFEDSTLNFGFVDFSVDARKIKDAGVQLLATCIDENGTANVARALHDVGLDIPLYLPNGYDHDFIQANGKALAGSYVGALFTPFETPGASKGLKTFLSKMKAANKDPNEIALAGWVSADMFVKGLRKAGKDFTRASLVSAINSMKDFTADGIIPPVDWTIAHTKGGPTDCSAFLQIQADGTMKPVLGQPDKPIVCLDNTTATIPKPTYL